MTRPRIAVGKLSGICGSCEGVRGFAPVERLWVYRLARKVLIRLRDWLARPPRRAADLGDHLDRALASVLLNIAEGSGKEPGSKDRARFYRMALGSAKEAAAALDILAIRYFIDPALAAEIREDLISVAAMLHRMAEL
jgi:four helix bundle protein